MNTQTHTGLHSLHCKYATIRTIHMGGNVGGEMSGGEMSGGEMSGYHFLYSLYPCPLVLLSILISKTLCADIASFSVKILSAIIRSPLVLLFQNLLIHISSIFLHM